MKGIKITILCIAIASVFGVANAETCVKTTYNVMYGCGEGTESGTLPADAVANYNTSFTPATLTSACTPPTGYKISGWAIYINNTQVAYTTSSSFTYSYTADSLITPNYVSDPSGLIATPADLAANLGVGGPSHTYVKGASGTWQVVFRYGIVNGVSKCTSVKPANTASGYYTGLIADYDEIEGAYAGGRYCYCKMTEPYIAASPWVFLDDYETASDCKGNCPRQCGYYDRAYDLNGRQFRASVFAGAL